MEDVGAQPSYIPLIPNHRCLRRQSLSTPSASVKSLHCPSLRWSRGDHLCCHRPHGACWSYPPPNQSGGGAPPLLGLDAVGGWALRSVVSIIRTAGSAASDANNSEKIRSNHIMGPDPREHLEPPQQSEGIRLGVNWDGKGREQQLGFSD